MMLLTWQSSTSKYRSSSLHIAYLLFVCSSFYHEVYCSASLITRILRCPHVKWLSYLKLKKSIFSHVSKYLPYICNDACLKVRIYIYIYIKRPIRLDPYLYNNIIKFIMQQSSVPLYICSTFFYSIYFSNVTTTV